MTSDPRTILLPPSPSIVDYYFISPSASHTLTISLPLYSSTTSLLYSISLTHTHTHTHTFSSSNTHTQALQLDALGLHGRVTLTSLLLSDARTAASDFAEDLAREMSVEVIKS